MPAGRQITPTGGVLKENEVLPSHPTSPNTCTPEATCGPLPHSSGGTDATWIIEGAPSAVVLVYQLDSFTALGMPSAYMCLRTACLDL